MNDKLETGKDRLQVTIHRSSHRPSSTSTSFFLAQLKRIRLPIEFSPAAVYSVV